MGDVYIMNKLRSKWLFIVFLLLPLLCSCSAPSEASETPSEVSLYCDIERYLEDFKFWYPPYVGVGPKVDQTPEYDITVEGTLKAGDASFECTIYEFNGKSIVVQPFIYLLEVKQDDGTWTTVGFTDYFFKRISGDVDRTWHLNNEENSETAIKNTIIIHAEHHGFDGFPAGEYRITRKVAAYVDGESVCDTLVKEFAITE